MIKFNYENAQLWLDKDIKTYQSLIDPIHNMITKKNGLGSDFLGWVEWINQDFTSLFSQISKIKRRLVDQNKIKYLVVIGIGGSYLGAKSALEMLKGNNSNDVEVIFSGTNLDSSELKKLITKLTNEKFAINIVSKSGRTLEPALSFRFLKDLLYKQDPENAKDLIVATTDSSQGQLYETATKLGYEKLIIPDDIGGRYSIFTSVGLLPLAIKGYNIANFIKGATDIQKKVLNQDLNTNIAYQYAVIRNELLKKSHQIEILVNYNYKLNYLSEWWKQLFGESEGKDGKGIFPASLSFTTDLHSLGQYIQDGPSFLFETIVKVEEEDELLIPYDEDDLDGLNYLANKPLSYVNEQAFRGTLNAHVAGDVPNLIITIKKLDEYHIGALYYFFLVSCAASAYLLGINPFDQPGVEAYKQQMYKLLGK